MQPFSFDEQITDWVVDNRHEPLTWVLHMVTVLGDTLTLALVVIGVAVLAWIANRIDFAASIVGAAVSGYLLMWILKVIFSRPRPPVEDRLIDVGGASFPSGHATLSTIVYLLSAVILYRLYPSVRARALWLLWLPVLLAAIGVSRVYLGVHWTSDILFGWVFGLIWLTIGLIGHAQLRKRRLAAASARRRAQSSPS
ncbi:phosphatase PAP2 family protein [Gordonia shandongensis]|uniref:phosphatase PAP2 family protein n=1 Tax=Gordonia shandongensis TaxID=376351 RepID=UPI00042493F7|nr:phosphatase PAP2 family protein [Gordonia shandongensis]